MSSYAPDGSWDQSGAASSSERDTAIPERACDVPLPSIETDESSSLAGSSRQHPLHANSFERPSYTQVLSQLPEPSADGKKPSSYAWIQPSYPQWLRMVQPLDGQSYTVTYDLGTPHALLKPKRGSNMGLDFTYPATILYHTPEEGWRQYFGNAQCSMRMLDGLTMSSRTINGLEARRQELNSNATLELQVGLETSHAEDPTQVKIVFSDPSPGRSRAFKSSLPKTEMSVEQFLPTADGETTPIPLIGRSGKNPESQSFALDTVWSFPCPRKITDPSGTLARPFYMSESRKHPPRFELICDLPGALGRGV